MIDDVDRERKRETERDRDRKTDRQRHRRRKQPKTGWGDTTVGLYLHPFETKLSGESGMVT